MKNEKRGGGQALEILENAGGGVVLLLGDAGGQCLSLVHLAHQILNLEVGKLVLAFQIIRGILKSIAEGVGEGSVVGEEHLGVGVAAEDLEAVAGRSESGCREGEEAVVRCMRCSSGAGVGESRGQVVLDQHEGLSTAGKRRCVNSSRQRKMKTAEW